MGDTYDAAQFTWTDVNVPRTIDYSQTPFRWLSIAGATGEGRLHVTKVPPGARFGIRNGTPRACVLTVNAEDGPRYPLSARVVLTLPHVVTAPAAVAQAALSGSGGVASITVADGGYGYVNPPLVGIQGDGGPRMVQGQLVGSRASAVAVVEKGAVTSIVVTDSGTNYTVANVSVQAARVDRVLTGVGDAVTQAGGATGRVIRVQPSAAVRSLPSPVAAQPATVVRTPNMVTVEVTGAAGFNLNAVQFGGRLPAYAPAGISTTNFVQNFAVLSSVVKRSDQSLMLHAAVERLADG